VSLGGERSICGLLVRRLNGVLASDLDRRFGDGRARGLWRRLVRGLMLSLLSFSEMEKAFMENCLGAVHFYSIEESGAVCNVFII